jgi:hypothetical protein
MMILLCSKKAEVSGLKKGVVDEVLCVLADSDELKRF